MKVIDLRSDTITLPTEEMRRAMYEAEVGDDVYGEDPTVNKLEKLAAAMLGKEAALFTASGTMSNLIAVLAHTHPGDEILMGSEAHMLWYEVGGAAALGGVVMRTVPNEQDGRMALEAVEDSIRVKNLHYPLTKLLCLENTHNRCGGAVLTPDYTGAVSAIAHQHGLQVHLDGARIFNAAIALGMAAGELAKPVDSVCFCLSKGLSAPVGSLLCGSQEFVDKARKWRKMLGGGMRQSGVIAAAGIVAVEKMVSRLADDHANARHLAEGLALISGMTIQPERFKTNIVVFESPLAISGDEFLERVNGRGIKLNSRGGRKFRAVTHRMVSRTDINEALNRIEILVKELG
jgi:threonine aldolase